MSLLLPLLLCTLLPAQPAPGRAGRAAQEGHILRQFTEIRISRIQQSLGLPADQARVIAERWGRWDRDVMERLRQMNQLRHQFSLALVGPGSEAEKSAQLQPPLEQFLALRRQQEEAKRRFEEEILVNLTPAQKVRLIILVEDLQPRLKDMLRDSRGQGRRY